MGKLSVLIARGEVCSCMRSKQMFFETLDPEDGLEFREANDTLPHGPFWCVQTQSMIGADGGLVSVTKCRLGRGCCQIS